MTHKTSKHPIASLILAVLVGIALQTASAQHLNVVSGTSLRLSGGTILGLDSLTVQNGGTGVFESGSAIEILAALVNGGTLEFGNGSTVIFAGGSQSLVGATTFAGLTKAGGGTLTLQSPVTVNGSLQLDSGRIDLGPYDLTIGPVGSINGASFANYVVTSDTGMLRQSVGASPSLFSVGPSAASYNPVTIDNSGIADVFSVRVQGMFDNPPPDPTSVVLRQWTIREQVPGGSNSTLVLQWNTAEEGTGFVRTNPISFGRYDGTQWQPTSAIVADLGGGVLTATAGGFDTFSTFVIGNDFTVDVPGEGKKSIPFKFALNQNYPNPFNPSTVIRYGLPERSNVRVEVYDVLGRRVAVLVDLEQEARYYELYWNATVPTGIYFYRIHAVAVANPDRVFRQIRKMVLVK